MSENEKLQKIEIKSCQDESAAFSEIFIDGHKLRGVRSYELKHVAGDVPILTVDLSALNISIDEPMLLMQKGFGIADIQFQEPSGDDS